MERPENVVKNETLKEFCRNSGGYEVLGQMIVVDPETMNIRLVPRCRQELIFEVDASERTIDRRLTEAHEELGILIAESGVGYDHFDDMRRVYRINPDRFNSEMLREVKIKGYIRNQQPRSPVLHADIEGGHSRFAQLPEWQEFVKEYLEK